MRYFLELFFDSTILVLKVLSSWSNNEHMLFHYALETAISSMSYIKNSKNEQDIDMPPLGEPLMHKTYISQ